MFPSHCDVAQVVQARVQGVTQVRRDPDAFIPGPLSSPATEDGKSCTGFIRELHGKWSGLSLVMWAAFLAHTVFCCWIDVPIVAIFSVLRKGQCFLFFTMKPLIVDSPK